MSIKNYLEGNDMNAKSENNNDKKRGRSSNTNKSGGKEIARELRSGKVVLLGEPNVGKSSLMNALIRAELSVVANLSGTTRDEIRGVMHGSNAMCDYEIIFLDTPGMRDARTAKTELARHMSKCISHAVSNADVICYVVDTNIEGVRDATEKIRNYEGKQPLIVVINKTDLVTKERLAKVISLIAKLGFVKAVVPTSCKNHENLNVLVREIANLLPSAQSFSFRDDEYTNLTTRKMCEEIIRGEVINNTYSDVPHGIAVNITKFNEKNKEITICVDIICEKRSQKPIIVGSRGDKIKKIGITSRAKIEKLTGKHIRLETYVRVLDNWRDKKTVLEEFGYTN